MKNFLGRESLTVSEAMRQIDGNQHKILFLTDDRQRLIGCVTDGDIRRFLLSGGAMSAPVLAAANRHPKSAKNMTEAGRIISSFPSLTGTASSSISLPVNRTSGSVPGILCVSPL